MVAKKTDWIGLRVKPELKAALSALSERDGRPFSQYVERALMQHVQDNPLPDTSAHRTRKPKT